MSRRGSVVAMVLVTVGLCTVAYSAAQPTAESLPANMDRDRWLREREVRALEEIARDLGKLQEGVNRLDRAFERNSRAVEDNTRALGRAR